MATSNRNTPIASLPDALQPLVEALAAAERWLAAEVEGSATPDQHEDVPSVGPTCVHCDIVALHDQLRAALAPYTTSPVQVDDSTVDVDTPPLFVITARGRAARAPFVAMAAG